MMKQLFYFQRAERNGVLTLLFLSFIVWFAPLFFAHFRNESSPLSDGMIAEVAEWQAGLQYEEMPSKYAFANNSYRKNDYSSANKSYAETDKTVKLFAFNPNTATEDELKQLGLPFFVPRNVVKFRNAGAIFKYKEDFRKIYGMDDENYDRIEAYIQLPEKGSMTAANLPKEKASFGATQAVKLFAFNPNTATEDELKQLGLPFFVPKNIVKFRSTGAVFKYKEDFQKIYGMDEESYERVKPYIQLPEKSTAFVPNTSNEMTPKPMVSPNLDPNTNANFTKQPKKSNAKIDINKATVEDWQQLRGIGVGYATRIVKFRDALGGFAKVTQVSETYGFPDSVYQKILPQLMIESSVYKPLNINTALADDLRKHPYLGWKIANILVSYREQHGAYKQVEDIKNIKIMTPELYEKISPYLSVK